ncbi:hypothetical protein [Halobellus marinus]|uniref:hypothetical protein n=1 Tax=Halobellus TaxID=1073986 RepID=UPI0028A5A062|nr:hypothetical protein [Halobellus sp. DFY28]
MAWRELIVSERDFVAISVDEALLIGPVSEIDRFGGVYLRGLCRRSRGRCCPTEILRCRETENPDNNEQEGYSAAIHHPELLYSV